MLTLDGDVTFFKVLIWKEIDYWSNWSRNWQDFKEQKYTFYIIIFSLIRIYIEITYFDIHFIAALPTRDPPVFGDNYYIAGVLLLPYAEIKEPFTAFFDKQNSRSRIDYYGSKYLMI